METKSLLPVCRAFLLCRETHLDPQRGDAILVGRLDAHAARAFPSTARVGFIARLTSARGSYAVAVQLHDEAGRLRGGGRPHRLLYETLQGQAG